MSIGKSNRRKQKRLSQRFLVRFGKDEPRYVGFAKNLSLGGLEISSNTIFYPHASLNLSIESEEKRIQAKGVVRWVSDNSQFVNANMKQFMGLDLIERPAEYVEFLLERVDRFAEKRVEPRFDKVFRVIFETPEDLLEEYAQDISIGGLFVITENPPPVNTFCSLQLVVPDTLDVINAEGEVVHVVTPAMAKETGLNQGVGIHFTQFLGDSGNVLEKYIKEMKSRTE